MGKLHSAVSTGENHIIHNYEYATFSAAEAASWTSDDIGKVFRITDSYNYYIILTSGGVYGEIDVRLVNNTQTTDATESNCGVFSTATDYIYYVDSIVTATVDGGGNAATYFARAAFKNDSGTLSQIGLTTVTSKEDAAGWDVDIDASGTDIRVRVTGQSSTTINWRTRTSIKQDANGA